MHYFAPESKQVQYGMASQATSTTQKFMTAVMASVFWDSGVIHVNFLPHGVTTKAQYYSNLLRNVCAKQFRTEDLGTVRGYSPHTANVMKGTLGNQEPPSIER
jgi:hypothetical protein